ncbi:MAG: radical SAM family heme chaperone HemW [Defluviitaleaceae bacterium]|nr:radical SAM family heme chaperone HemW [Defluviitaleaceae bacterium]
MPTGVYIHIPFCLRKCIYCDFLSFPQKDENFSAYVNALVQELKTAKLQQVDTVYIGGGTPTVLPHHLMCEILQTVEGLPLMKNTEITVEANPGTLTPEYLKALKTSGVTRLSIGLQTTHPELLQTLSRAHSKDDFTKNFHAAREAGFDNINIDLMFALPSQTHEHWLETLKEVIILSPEHISAYSLIPPENVDMPIADDDTDRKMYHNARKILTDAGYIHYELSNFAKPDKESRHNINCWKMKPYIGFGLGAHSFDGRTRWHNNESLDAYIHDPQDKKNLHHLTETDLMAEEMILGLRLCEGVNEPLHYKNEIAKLVNDGLLTRQQGKVALTPYGMDFANQVFIAFL